MQKNDIDKLAMMGEQARKQLDDIIRNFDRMLELNPESVTVLRLYAVLCLEIFGDVGKAHELFSKAESIMQNKRKSLLETDYGAFLRPIDAELDILDDDNGVVTISIAPDALGIVQSANPSFAKMFGYMSGKDFVGKSINRIIPKPFHDYHDQYLTDYAAGITRSVRINKTSMLIAQHYVGHLIPIAIYMRWADQAAAHLIATVKPIVNPQEVCFFVDPEKMTVTSATANFPSFFGFSKRDVLAHNISLFDVLPELRDPEAAHHISETVYQQLVSYSLFALIFAVYE